MASDDTAAKRARLAALEAELSRLRERYDLLTNAFKFDAARALHARIEAAERERRDLATALPPPASSPPPAPYSVARPRRRR